METTTTEVEKNVFNRVWQRLANALNPQPDSAFAVQKDLNGQWRWIATFSNNFKDRDGEIISEKAWDGYLERIELGLVPMPELWVGHVDGTKHGKADMVFGTGSFVTAVGSFDDTPEAKHAIEYYRKEAAKIQLSHGFTFPSWGLKDGIYEVVNTFEISTLPAPLMASNPFTEFEVNAMKQISPETKVALSRVFGAEKTDALIQSRETQSEEIKAAGIAFKDFAEVVEVPAVVVESEAETETAPADDNKPVAELLSALIEDMGALLAVQAEQGKALKAIHETRVAEKAAQATKEGTLEAQIIALKGELASLRKELSLTPVRASESASTVIPAEKAADILGEPATDIDKFFQI